MVPPSPTVTEPPSTDPQPLEASGLEASGLESSESVNHAGAGQGEGDRDEEWEAAWAGVALDEEWDSEEPPLESDWHREQIDLLVRLLHWFWRHRDDFYASGNTTVYYDLEGRTNRNFRGPDFYVVLGATKRKRKSWMLWREAGQYPHVVVELLSPSTARVDRTTKRELYQNTWRVLDYFWFNPQTLEFQGFELVGGVYESIQPTEQGWLWSEQLQLYLGLHQEILRFFTPEGELVLLEEEETRQQAEQERLRADEERLRADEERLRADEERLRADEERRRADQAEAIAQQERQRADAERVRAEQLAERLRQVGLE